MATVLVPAARWARWLDNFERSHGPTAHAVADALERLDVPIVFDPVMVATSGSVLADADTIRAFERLMRIASVTTPNMPELEAHLHYRIVDVSSVKELARRWYPRAYYASPEKTGGHRALGDIRDSIAELRYYREAVFVPRPGPTTEQARALAAPHVVDHGSASTTSPATDRDVVESTPP